MNRKLVILGGGESGVGTALLAQMKGYDVFLSDSGTLRPHHRDELTAAGIDFEEGGHTAGRVLAADEVVKSPGIPEKAPMVRALRDKGVRIVSEIEFAGRFTRARKICITGANGKTTTTLLTHHLLRTAGIRAETAGNVGTSLARQIARGNEPDWYVIELSSFQLDGMYDFRADIGILCNITPDHLDRYEYKYENYIRSKFRILQNQTPADAFICDIDDPTTAEWLPQMTVGARLFEVSQQGRGQGAYAEGGLMHIGSGEAELVVPESGMKLKGRHNVYNAMQAALAAQLAGACNDDIARGLASFAGVEHRLEHVRDLDGVEYINDSKATTVNSAWFALESMTRPVVWIAGGTDKGNDYSELYDLVRDKVKALVCLGVDNGKLLEAFADKTQVSETRSMDECVARCRQIASAGDVVLLSPCCASFDLFRSYEHRGELFKQAVSNL